MFGINKRLSGLEQRLIDMDRIQESSIAEMTKLQSENDELKVEVQSLKQKVEELSKRTISQTTTAEDKPISFNQLVDEWINGEQEEQND